MLNGSGEIASGLCTTNWRITAADMLAFSWSVQREQALQVNAITLHLTWHHTFIPLCNLIIYTRFAEKQFRLGICFLNYGHYQDPNTVNNVWIFKMYSQYKPNKQTLLAIITKQKSKFTYVGEILPKLDLFVEVFERS